MDPRITPARPDVAALFLKGKVQAERFVQGEECRLAAPYADLWQEPGGTRASQLLALDIFDVYARQNGLAWGQNRRDLYVGYVAEGALAPGGEPITHRVVSTWAHRHPEPMLKAPPQGPALPFMAGVTVLGESGGWLAVPGGWCPGSCLAPEGSLAGDPATVAARFLGLPYLWGGTTPLGLDCSGLIQLAFLAAGRVMPRDSDQQERAAGDPVPPDAPLQRGDLVFWDGHVGLMQDAATLIHANAHAMAVTAEPLAQVIARAESSGSAVSSRQRPNLTLRKGPKR